MLVYFVWLLLCCWFVFGLVIWFWCCLLFEWLLFDDFVIAFAICLLFVLLFTCSSVWIWMAVLGGCLLRCWDCCCLVFVLMFVLRLLAVGCFAWVIVLLVWFCFFGDEIYLVCGGLLLFAIYFVLGVGCLFVVGLFSVGILVCSFVVSFWFGGCCYVTILVCYMLICSACTLCLGLICCCDYVLYLLFSFGYCCLQVFTYCVMLLCCGLGWWFGCLFEVWE